MVLAVYKSYNLAVTVKQIDHLSISLRSTMASLPPPHLNFSSVNDNEHHQDISKDNLLALFTSQHDLLNHLFKHLDLER
ncbi:hypothetical protein YC2023_102310 [Brassica napus]